MPTEPLYTPGQRVRLKAMPERAGLVTKVSGYDGGWQYEVFFSASDTPLVNERGLEPTPEGEDKAHVVGRDSFLRSLVLTKLGSKLNDVLYAYQASRTQFEAYQFKPVLKFLDSPVPSILIADEVGLGKTIEAAILLQELRARGAMRRVLVICPAGLRAKWQAELLNRFDEQFQLMYRKELQSDIQLYEKTDGNNPLNGIVSLESFRSREIQDLLSESGVTYDLVIIDEAHHLRTTGTLSNIVGERMHDLSEHLLLLTATPLQTSQQDLLNLLRFIDPGQFSDLRDFELQLQPNALLNEAISHLRRNPPDLASARATLDRIADLEAGSQVTLHPTYRLVRESLDQPAVDRDSLVRLRRDIDSLNVISAIYTRTIKRDVSSAAARKAHVIDVAVTEEEADFLAAVLAHARAQARQKSPSGAAPGFAGIMRERQAASCIAAMREYLEGSLEARAQATTISLLSEASSPELGEEDPTAESASFDAQRSEAQLAAAATALGDTDSKFDAFLESLSGVLAENDHSKVIVFTFFRRTIAYLERQLRQRGVPIAVIHGDIGPDDRQRVIANFQESAISRVLLTTEVGAEGLDFQFCDTMFNYDLPWNPMRVEQRIGRIDRYGQRSRQVRIYSFFLRGTIEERILERLYTRIGIFEESIGELEPILGPLVNELTRDIFRSDLTPEEEAEVAERYAQMIIQRRQQERDLEASSSKLLGQDALLMQAIDESIQSGRYVSPAELRALVAGYVQDVMGAELVDRAGDGRTVLIPTDAKLTSALMSHLQEKQDRRQVATDFLQKALKSPRVAATFEGELALRRPALEFLNLRHPLVRMAIEHHEAVQAGARAAYPFVCVRADATGFEPEHGPWPEVGDYEFMLVLLSVSGAIEQSRIVPIAFEIGSGRRVIALEDRLLRMVQGIAVDDIGVHVTPAERADLEERAAVVAASIADQAHAEAVDRNAASIAVRRATLERTFGHRIQRRQTLLEQAEDERIRRMRSSEIANLKADLARRITELESKQDVAVTRKVIGGGRVSIHVGLRRPETDTRVLTEPPLEEEVGAYPEPPSVFRSEGR